MTAITRIKHSLFCCCFLPFGILSAQLFTERAAEMGVDHYTNEPSAMGGGVAIFDFDNDGFEDLYLTGGDAPDLLYHNQGDGTFADVSRAMRITAFNIVTTMGVTAGDIDNDGFTDLFVTTAEGRRNYLLRNVEGRYFQDISLAAGIHHEAWSMTAAMADYDGDGFLDIYVGNYLTFTARPFEENISGPEANFLYRNEGNGTFTLLDDAHVGIPPGCTLVSHFSDYDRDGDQDLFVLNDFGDFYQPNQLLTQRDTTPPFAATGRPAGFRAAINSMGIAAGDLNEDGLLDYYVTNIDQNPLYLSTAGGGFTDRAAEMGVNFGFGVSWGTVFRDFDNDGMLDLYFANGDLSQSTVNTRNNLFMGDAIGLPFREASARLPDAAANKGRGVACGDFDNDGFPDLVTSNVRLSAAHGAGTKLYHNEGARAAQNWVTISLEGVTSNRSAIGAMVEIYTDGRRQLRELSAGGSYLSCNSRRLSFGLGGFSRIDSVVIQWPRPGGPQVLPALPANTHYEVRQGGPARIRRAATARICPGGEAVVAGAVRTEAGVYRETVTGPYLDTVIVTRLTLREGPSVDCREPGGTGTEFRVFPNPTSRGITIDMSGAPGMDGTVSVRLLDLSGRIVFRRVIRFPAAGNGMQVEISSRLPPGVYLLLADSGKVRHRSRLVKVE